MTPSTSRMTRRSLRAPQEANKVIVEPPSYSLGSVITENRAWHAAASVMVGEVSLVDISNRARSELYQQALHYTSQYRSVAAYRDTPHSFILSGHQPQLFHPGVWIKNVALSQWARQQSANGTSTCGIQLIVDTDLCRDTTIRVPTGTIRAPSITSVAYDEATAPLPFEERSILDPETFCSFDSRICDAIEALIPSPLVTPLWSAARKARQLSSNLGQALAQARHSYEQAWGLETLELPWSKVCDSDPFRHFIVAVLQRLSDFHTIYNETIREYRRANKIRGRSRPVAELSIVDGWIETPFWCWTSEAPERRPLFVRAVDSVLELRSGNNQVSTLRLCNDIPKAVVQLADARANGFKVRSRALVTTMYARLFLGDLFIHGIGGAKYDELTDEIVQRFWNLSPPKYFVVSATVPLPIPRPTAETDDLRRLDGMLRDMWYHPENHINEGNESYSNSRPSSISGETKRLVEQKRHWINSTTKNAKMRHDGIVSTTVELRKHVATARAALIHQRQQLIQQLRQSAILSSREYSFCLFPENKLRRTLLDILP